MSYYISLYDSKERPITKEMVEQAIKELPGHILMIGKENHWGWQLCSSVRLRDGKIKLSGSFSGAGARYAMELCLRLQQELRKHGLDIVVTSHDYTINQNLIENTDEEENYLTYWVSKIDDIYKCHYVYPETEDFNNH